MTADDLEVGMMVTVREWYENRNVQDAPPSYDAMIMFGPGYGRERKKRNFMGTVLRIEAVSLPYVACRIAFVGQVVVLDVREVELTRVHPQFVEFMEAYHEAEQRKEKKGPSETDVMRAHFKSMFGPVVTIAEEDEGEEDDDHEEDDD